MREILLTKGFKAVVDDSDFEELSKYKWSYHKDGYAVRTTYENPSPKNYIYKKTYMHIQIMGKRDGFEIDHINGNGLDNRRENLRHVTNSQNNQNRRSDRPGGTSQYKGVDWIKSARKWRARIILQGTEYSLGCYASEKDAALVYNVWAESMFGKYARPNKTEGKTL